MLSRHSPFAGSCQFEHTESQSWKGPLKIQLPCNKQGYLQPHQGALPKAQSRGTDAPPGLLLQPSASPISISSSERSHVHRENAAIRKKKTFNTFIQRYKLRFGGLFLFFFSPLQTITKKVLQVVPADRLISIHLSRSQQPWAMAAALSGAGTGH